ATRTRYRTAGDRAGPRGRAACAPGTRSIAACRRQTQGNWSPRALLTLEHRRARRLLVDTRDVLLDLGSAVLDVVLQRGARGDALLLVERALAAERVDALGLALAHLLAGGAAGLGAAGGATEHEHGRDGAGDGRGNGRRERGRAHVGRV